MNTKLRDGAMIAGMVVAWSIFYAVSKHMVDATGSPFAAGFLLRMGALAFLTVQLAADGHFRALFHQGRAADGPAQDRRAHGEPHHRGGVP